MPQLTAIAVPADPEQREQHERPRLALAVIVTCQLMLILDATVMNVALPRIRGDLGFSATGLSWVMSAYTLAFGGLLLVGGRLGDLLGRRRTFVAGVALFTVASFAGGLATGPATLLAARVLQGVGAAMAGPNTIALIATTVTEPRARIRALALMSAVASGGFAIGLIVGGMLTEVGSWRWVLFVNVPFGVAAVVLAPRYVREPERHPARLHVPDAVTAIVGTASVVYGLVWAAGEGWSDWRTLLPLVGGVALLVGFVLRQRVAAEPLLPLRLFADRNRAAGFANFFLGPASMMSMFFFLTQYLQTVRGYGAVATGFAFLPLAVAMFATTRVVPRLLPRFGPKPLAITGAVLMVTGLALLTRLTADSGYLGALLAPVTLMGFGGGLAFVPLTPMIMSTVPAKDAGAAGGVLQTMQQTGSALGLAVLVTVFGTASRHADFVTGARAAFVASTVVALGTVAVATTFRRESAN